MRKMNRNVLNILFWVFTLLPFLIAIGLLFVLPETVSDTVPMYWTLEQGAEGYNSKYLILLIPVLFAVSSIMTKIIMSIIEESTWKGNTKSDELIIQYFSLFTSFVLFGVSIGLFWLIASTSIVA
jgi:hypothetical protein